MGSAGLALAPLAITRLYERDALRRYRELEQQAREQEKRSELQQAAFVVEKYETKIKQLRSIHQDCRFAVNWSQLANSEPPMLPKPTVVEQTMARFRLEAFQPSIADNLLGRSQLKYDLLNREYDDAVQKDQQRYQRLLVEHEKNFNDWVELKLLANQVISGNLIGFHRALEWFKPFLELQELGSKVTVDFITTNQAEIRFLVNINAVLPRESKSLLHPHNKVLTQKMSDQSFSELSQFYVYGAVIRICREVFALLPLEGLLITATMNIADFNSGHMQCLPILSLIISKTALNQLRFDSLDLTSVLHSFQHRVNFSTQEGFLPIEPLNW